MNKRVKNNLKEFLQIKNSTETTCDLYFYGDIVDGWWGAWDDTDQYPEAIKDFLYDAKGKDINIYINSGGGSVFAGMAIYNMLKRHQGHKTVYVDGLAGSISSVIALAGDKVVIPSNAYMMIHKPWCYANGNSNELRDVADVLDKIEEGIVNVYSENLTQDADIEEIKTMMNAETWLTGEEASKYFNVHVTDSVEAVACASDYFNKYSKVPKSIKKDDMFDTKNKINNKKEILLMELDLI